MNLVMCLSSVISPQRRKAGRARAGPVIECATELVGEETPVLGTGVKVKRPSKLEKIAAQNVRVRCAWENTPQGLLRRPLSELVRLEVDGREVKADLFSKQRPNGLYDDHYHHVHFDSLPPGKHIATAVVRTMESNAETTRSVEFRI